MINLRGKFFILFCVLTFTSCFSEVKPIKLDFNQSKPSGNLISELKSTGKLVSLVQGYDGQALQCLGDSHFVTADFVQPISIKDGFTISFRFNREDWVNPYKKGRASQTLFTLKSKTDQGVYNLIFNYSTYQDRMEVKLTAPRKRSIKLKSEKGVIADQWHMLVFSYDPSEEKYILRLDDKISEFKEDQPQMIDYPLTQIKLCTWFKMNQAFKGLIDDVQIRPEALSQKEISKL